MSEGVAASVVLGAGLYLVALAVALVARPGAASRFLLGFAASARVHYAELGLRAAVGWSFVEHAPRMLFPGAFAATGWVLVITTAGLLLVPWRWHRRFARKAVPPVVEHSGLLALGALAAGALVISATLLGNTG